MQLGTCRPTRCIFCAVRDEVRRPPYVPLQRSARLSSSPRCSRRLPSHARARRESDFEDVRTNDGDYVGLVRPKFIKEHKAWETTTRRPDFVSDLPKTLNKRPSFLKARLAVKSGRPVDLSNLRPSVRRSLFREVLQNSLNRAKEDIRSSSLLEGLELDNNAIEEAWEHYEDTVWASQESLKEIYEERGKDGLYNQHKYAFYGQVSGAEWTEIGRSALADLRYPTEWYPRTRVAQRKIHLHVGPTNSGKTYQALKRLEEAHTGVYAGPLRLLAHEVYTRMNAKGKPTVLVTGEERRIPDDLPSRFLISCTVEMIPVGKEVEVAVIDEIQMISSDERGWAWTQALLGVRAKELHLCGEERSVQLVRELAAATGDDLEIHHYERLSPLKMMDKSLNGDLSKLQKGDCVVSFSVMGIHALRKEIESTTGKKVAIVYGSLPPETRAQQAKLFNDPNNEYDVLVASDAIGMGLNLSIKRIIFESAWKSNGYARVPLKTQEVKQIAGRAGRYRTAEQDNKDSEANRDKATDSDPSNAIGLETPPKEGNQSVGLVTTLEKSDYFLISRGMTQNAEPIRSAGIHPPDIVVQRFASYFPPHTPFSYILVRLNEIAKIHPRFHLCKLKDALMIADEVQGIKNLTVVDRMTLCSAPIGERDLPLKSLLKDMARAVSNQRGGGLLDLPSLKLEILDEPISGEREYLRRLEMLHKGLVLYLWLSFRFSGVFNTRSLAVYTKGLVEQAIEQSLAQYSFQKDYRKVKAKQDERKLLEMLQRSLQGGSGGVQGQRDLEAEHEGDERLQRAQFEGDGQEYAPDLEDTISEDVDEEEGDSTDQVEMFEDGVAAAQPPNDTGISDDSDEYPEEDSLGAEEEEGNELSSSTDDGDLDDTPEHADSAEARAYTEEDLVSAIKGDGRSSPINYDDLDDVAKRANHTNAQIGVETKRGVADVEVEVDTNTVEAQPNITDDLEPAKDVETQDAQQHLEADHEMADENPEAEADTDTAEANHRVSGENHTDAQTVSNKGPLWQAAEAPRKTDDDDDADADAKASRDSSNDPRKSKEAPFVPKQDPQQSEASSP